MPKEFSVQAIGYVKSERDEAIDDNWDELETRIELDETHFTTEAMLGLTDFSHVEVIFLFHRVPQAKIERGARHPRGRRDWPRVGVFAQRGKNRPNRLGATICEILRVEGTALYVKGLDAIEGTPVLDIKPVMSGFERRGILREPAWAKEIMLNYWA